MLSSVPPRIFMRRSRSLSPCRVLQTSTKDAARNHIIVDKADANRNPIVSTSRVSRRGILSEEAKGQSVSLAIQYHHLAPRWLSNLQGRRSSWASLASKGRNNNNLYWDQSGERTGGQSGSSRPYALASAGVLSAAAMAFCLKKDSDTKGDALLEAARTNSSQDVARLLGEGVEPNHRHRLGWTSLMVAAMNRQHRSEREQCVCVSGSSCVNLVPYRHIATVECSYHTRRLLMPPQPSLPLPCTL
ncbi:uncharacterized protein LOC127907568 [Oncorhynchus keta]|uniref:uncharacterized protein LOC127907568 n=1 Tax=Oncorhynchus keta TaxID=8018 RepID=UPI00227B8C38|nr:uncharacterized protein LOC127907568 [Oncorhynchus keta]